MPSKFDGWGGVDFEKAGFRAVPSAIVRRSAYIAPGAVLMPSFVNLGAYVGEGTLVDTWATVGSIYSRPSFMRCPVAQARLTPSKPRHRVRAISLPA